jgi:hypothetical protein
MFALRKTLAIALVFAFSVTAYAATDGTLGSTSTGTASVSVTVPNLIRITGMADFPFGAYGGSGDLNNDQNVCVYTNKASGTYRVTGTGSGGGGAFTLAKGGDTLDYAVYFNDVTGTTGEQPLTAGSALAGQSGANTSSQTCGGGSSANYHVEILETDLLAVPAGAYSGTLSILVEPV